MNVHINPGHGGNDPGACGHGLKEAEVTLKIGRLVEKYLQAVGINAKTFQYDGLAEICHDANQWNADLFVSIHCNAAENPAANGTETFCARGSTTGRALAEKIHNQIKTSLPLTDRGVKEAGYYVLTHTDMPAVLVETAFITNAEDAKLLAEKQDDFARAIARGITDFIGGNSKPLPDVVDKPSPASGKLSEHFDAAEFSCHHCGMGGEGMNPKLIELLEKLRENMGGLPIHINSGYRCPIHNANVGGVRNSQHVLKTAADLAVPAGLSFGQFQWYIDQLPFDGIGLYPDSDFIHVDVRNGGIGSKIYWNG